MSRGAGHEVRTTDLTRPGYERKPEGTPRYTMADLTGHPPHVVFQTNLMASRPGVQMVIFL